MSKYRKKITQLEVEAVRLTAAVYDEEGNKLAAAGDWLVVREEGHEYLTEAEFNRMYEAVISTPYKHPVWGPVYDPAPRQPIQIEYDNVTPSFVSGGRIKCSTQ